MAPSLDPVPAGRTARRLTWPHLPPELRARIEQRLGSPVTDWASQDSGFTPGFASVLTCANGGLHFVKAASVAAQRSSAASYRAEARVLSALPPGVPAPRLQWSLNEEWVVLGIDYVQARQPHRPWSAGDLDSALAALTRCAAALTPAPEGLEVADFRTEFASLPACWEHVRATRPGWPRLDEAQALADGFAEVTGGETLVHTDVRDDNLLVRPDGTAMVCDWNWAVHGAAWIDTVFALLGPRGDGMDVDTVLAEHPLTREVPAEHVDRMLALLVGFFAKSADDPVMTASPYLRRHQAWCRDVVWEWLKERRDWQ